MKPMNKTEHRKISDDDLIKLLNDEGELPPEDFDGVTDVPDFLIRYEITVGTNNVAIREIYSLYVKFTKKPIPYNYFLSIMLNRFEHAKSVKGKNNRILVNFPPEFFVKRRVEKLKRPRLMRDNDKVKGFLKHFSIRHGINPIPLDVLYYKFCLYAEENDIQLIGYVLFEKTFRHVMHCRHLSNGDIVAMADIKMTALFPKDVCKFLLHEARKMVEDSKKTIV
jgi:hypothetical protein